MSRYEYRPKVNGMRRCPRSGGKIMFPDKKTAMDELISAMARGREEKRVYECEHCNHWHLTQRKTW